MLPILRRRSSYAQDGFGSSVHSLSIFAKVHLSFSADRHDYLIIFSVNTQVCNGTRINRSLGG